MCRKPGDKRKAQLKHAAKRAFARFGLELGPNENAELVRLIQYNGAKLLDKQSNRISRWVVTWRDQTFVAVYDKKRQTIVTVLSPDVA